MPSSFKTKALAAAALGATCLAAPPAQANLLDSYPYGPPPEWARFKELGEAAIRASMLDPESARITWPNAVIRNAYRPLLGKRIFGYLTCGLVNGRNRFGGYVGDAYFVVVIDNDKVLYSQIGKGGGSDLLGTSCSKISFPPSYDVMPDKSSSTAPAPGASPPVALGLTVMQVPDGAYVSASAAGSPAQRAGIVPGMVITSINGIGLKGLPGPAVTQMLSGVTAIKVTP